MTSEAMELEHNHDRWNELTANICQNAPKMMQVYFILLKTFPVPQIPSQFGFVSPTFREGLVQWRGLVRWALKHLLRHELLVADPWRAERWPKFGRILRNQTSWLKHVESFSFAYLKPPREWSLSNAQQPLFESQHNQGFNQSKPTKKGTWPWLKKRATFLLKKSWRFFGL